MAVRGALLGLRSAPAPPSSLEVALFRAGAAGPSGAPQALLSVLATLSPTEMACAWPAADSSPLPAPPDLARQMDGLTASARQALVVAAAQPYEAALRNWLLSELVSRGAHPLPAE
ncbi:hypothetical protein AB0L14_21715 [Streptomyces sp. NPDC052727]|uniref:hypothetical protein n=1 Tax=Streptomyces sp. NPDC052727 TaxID=3154854 RepID=UPI003440351F